MRLGYHFCSVWQSIMCVIFLPFANLIGFAIVCLHSWFLVGAKARCNEVSIF